MRAFVFTHCSKSFLFGLSDIGEHIQFTQEQITSQRFSLGETGSKTRLFGDLLGYISSKSLLHSGCRIADHVRNVLRLISLAHDKTCHKYLYAIKFSVNHFDERSNEELFFQVVCYSL